MKKVLYTLTLALVATFAQAQVKVGANPGTINGGSVLEMEATDKGMLLPRVALSATNIWGLAGTPAAGMLVYNTVAAGSGTTAVLANTVYFWNGTVWFRIAANTDNTTTTAPFAVGETRSARMVVPYTTFKTNSGSRQVMTGKAVGNVTTTNRNAATSLATNSPALLVVNGLRLDFLQSALNAQNVSPKLYNTTSSAIVYSISSLSTNDAYRGGSNTTIASNAYSSNIDGDDNFGTSQSDSEYVNSMLSFPNGEWYNCTWHATTDGTNYYYFYVTAQRLN